MLLRHPSTFRRLWIGQSVSVIGDGMQRLALLWWAKHHGGNGLLVTVALSTVIPVVVGSPLGGWLADRVERRRLLLGADLARLATSGVLAGLLLAGRAAPVAVCALVVVAGLGTALFDPTYASAVPTLVADDDLPAANGLNMAQGAVGGLAGPLIAGLLIGVADLGWVMVINAATFLWSATCVAGCVLPRPGAAVAPAGGDGTPTGLVPDTPPPGGLRAGLEVVRGVTGLGSLVALASTLNMVVAPVPVLIAALAVDRFDAGPRTFGLLEVLLSAGLLVGSLLAGRLARGRLRSSFVVLGACLAVAGALPLGGVAVALVFAGLAIAVANTEAITLFQRAVPSNLHGRVFGVLGAFAEGLRPAGLALAAPLLGAAGVTGAFLVVGLCVIGATVALGRRLPAVRGGSAAAGSAAAGSAAGDDEHVGAVDVAEVGFVGVDLGEPELA